MTTLKKVIITGATGAIGMALIKMLVEQGIETSVLIRPDSQRKHRLLQFPQIHLISCGLENMKFLSADDLGSYDAFFHLAWEGTIGTGRDDLEVQLQNVRYTLDAVELAHRLGCSVFIGAGSQAEYGRVNAKLTADTPTFPEMGYGIAKLCAGQMSRLSCHTYGIRHNWVRILSVYGPYDGEKTMIMTGIRAMLRGEIPVFSKGEQQWDYLYSEDAAKAILRIALYGKDDAIYPLGSGKTCALYEYIEQMRTAVGANAKVSIGALPYRSNQVMYLCADISELERDTGWVPETDFKIGIEKTIAWCRNSGED